MRKPQMGLCGLLLSVASLAYAEKADFKGCYAEWENGRLTVGNALFERVWVAGDAGLVPVSFVVKNPDAEWLANSARQTKAVGVLG